MGSSIWVGYGAEEDHAELVWSEEQLMTSRRGSSREEMPLGYP